MQGYDAMLTTGTDEHGQKVERSAPRHRPAPRRNLPRLSPTNSVPLWDRIGIQYDHFIRTTEPRHHETVQLALRPLPRQRLHL